MRVISRIIETIQDRILFVIVKKLYNVGLFWYRLALCAELHINKKSGHLG